MSGHFLDAIQCIKHSHKSSRCDMGLNCDSHLSEGHKEARKYIRVSETASSTSVQTSVSTYPFRILNDIFPFVSMLFSYK